MFRKVQMHMTDNVRSSHTHSALSRVELTYDRVMHPLGNLFPICRIVQSHLSDRSQLETPLRKAARLLTVAQLLRMACHDPNHWQRLRNSNRLTRSDRSAACLRQPHCWLWLLPPRPARLHHPHQHRHCQCFRHRQEQPHHRHLPPQLRR